jgi:hypothetical protein
LATEQYPTAVVHRKFKQRKDHFMRDVKHLKLHQCTFPVDERDIWNSLTG